MNMVPMPASCRSTPTAPMTTAADSTATAITRLNRSIRSTSGGLPASAAVIEMASRPTAVRAPVATTTPWPRPRATVVPANAMLRQSAGPASVAPIQAASLRTGSDSPVSKASPISRPWASSSRRSAGTRCPVSRATTSPGTTSALSSSTESPSRSTVARIWRSFWRLWLCCSARHSCQPPSVELSNSTTPMKAASLRSPSNMAAMAAASRT
jgi:hypothetical protein